ncbi:MAG TPA: aldehyde dehydrogenase family protein [Mycobacteriales bacterium]|jgi:glutamate-5-semialdehyde dehydrogenase|nr:aldehyde dehydrogenase family protein [Mycobacteriales bacterium]
MTAEASADESAAFTDAEREEVRAAGERAAAAAREIRRAPDEAVDAALRAAAHLLSRQSGPVLAANATDLQAAERAGISAGLLDRLRLDSGRIDAMVAQLQALVATPKPPVERLIRELPDGGQVYERRVPVGVVGAIFEARPNVPIDLASQVLTARSAAVLRTGSAALVTSAALVDSVLAPALAEADLPTDAVQLLRSGGHGTAEALLTQPGLIPLVVVRGSGPVTAHLSRVGAAHGVQVLSHADGGGVLYLHPAADPAAVDRLIGESLDRLGVCNRLNLLLLDADLPTAVADRARATLAALGVTLSEPPYAHPLGYEWALDADAEATVTVATVTGPADAAALADRETSGLAATICTEDPVAAEEFLAAYTGTGALWNVSTRIIDGYKLLGLPETGINVDHGLGPRGPVTFPDLGMRQFVVRPARR